MGRLEVDFVMAVRQVIQIENKEGEFDNELTKDFLQAQRCRMAASHKTRRGSNSM